MEIQDFIKILSTLSPQEINTLIEEKGKTRRLVEPFILINK